MLAHRLVWPLYTAFIGAIAGATVVGVVLTPEPPRTHYYDHSDQSAKTERAQTRQNGSLWIPQDSVGFYALWTAVFTGVLALSTIALWSETGLASERQVAETRRIGEAQVRAYVHIKSAGVNFVMFGAIIPAVRVVAANSGQSPARNFLWNVTLQYPAPTINRQSILNPNWRSGIGYDIPANSEAPPESSLIPNMAVNQLPSGTTITPVRLKIEYRFTDVFDKDWFGEAYFAGTMRWTPQTAEGFPTSSEPWQAKIAQMPKPRDWDSVGKNQDS